MRLSSWIRPRRDCSEQIQLFVESFAFSCLSNLSSHHNFSINIFLFQTPSFRPCSALKIDSFQGNLRTIDIKDGENCILSQPALSTGLYYIQFHASVCTVDMSTWVIGHQGNFIKFQ